MRSVRELAGPSAFPKLPRRPDLRNRTSGYGLRTIRQLRLPCTTRSDVRSAGEQAPETAKNDPPNETGKRQGPASRLKQLGGQAPELGTPRELISTRPYGGSLIRIRRAHSGTP